MHADEADDADPVFVRSTIQHRHLPLSHPSRPMTWSPSKPDDRRQGQNRNPTPIMPIPHPNGVWMGRRWAISARRKPDPSRRGMGIAPPPVRGFDRISRLKTVVDRVL